MDITLNVSSIGTTDVAEYIIANNYPLLDMVHFLGKSIYYGLVVSSIDPRNYPHLEDVTWHTLDYLKPHIVRRYSSFRGCWIYDIDNHYYMITN